MRSLPFLALALAACGCRSTVKTAPAHFSPVKGIQRTITLAWDNKGAPNPFWETGLEGSVDLRAWYELAVLPYNTNAVFVTLTNRPMPLELYRAFNRIKAR